MTWLVLGEYSQQTGISITVGDLATLCGWTFTLFAYIYICFAYFVCLILPSEPRGDSWHRTFFLVFPTASWKSSWNFWVKRIIWIFWWHLMQCLLKGLGIPSIVPAGFWCMHRKLVKEEMATHSSILAGRIPWTQEPGGLQCRGVTNS